MQSVYFISPDLRGCAEYANIENLQASGGEDIMSDMLCILLKVVKMSLVNKGVPQR